MRPGAIKCRVTRRTARTGLAPDMTAASSSAGSMERSSGTSIRNAVGTRRRPSMKIMPPMEYMLKGAELSPKVSTRKVFTKPDRGDIIRTQAMACSMEGTARVMGTPA